MTSLSIPVSNAPADAVDLRGLTVLVLTSGHEVSDARVYAREAASVARMGASVTIVGRHTAGALPTDVRILVVKPPASRWERFLVQPWRCVWAARKESANIIHVHDAEMLITLPVAKLIWPRAKFVYDVHEDFGQLVRIRSWLPSWVRNFVGRITDFVEKAIAKFADGIVAVTPPLGEKFSNTNKVTTYNFSPRDRNAHSRTQRRLCDRTYDLVHLGTLSRRRALFLAEVLREFHRLRPNARSLVVGVAPDIRSEIEMLIPGNCTLVSWKPYAEIPAILSDGKIGLDVHPWPDPHLRVALPVKVCEYMCAGCAVVSSAMGVLCRILEEGNADSNAIKIIEGGTPIDYARAVDDLLSDIDSGRDLGATLQRFAFDNMSWEKEAEKLGRFYLKLQGSAIS